MDNFELHGRKPIYTSISRLDPNDLKSVVDEVNLAITIHGENLTQMEYLYLYRRGITPVQGKTKDIRPEINNKVSVNLASSIVDFHNGYFLTQPATYIPRKGREETADKVKLLNEYLYRSGKHDADNAMVDWFHTVGKADLFVRSIDDPEMPFEAVAVDPRNVFVALSTEPGNKPVFAGYIVIQGEEIRIDVWDRENVYHMRGGKTGELTTPFNFILSSAIEVTSVEPNPLGEIPIIEYQYNSIYMSCFELALPLIDAISQIQSDRLDGLDQFIQSLLVFYNCELGEDADGNEITPKQVRDAGALFLQSIGENKADLKEISSQLDQSQTQVLINNLYELVLAICGMPTDKGSFPGDSTGLAIELRDGWQICEMNARNTEDLFKKSNRQFDRIALSILKQKAKLIGADELSDLSLTDFELHFTRNELRAVQSKAQALQTLLSAGLHPTLALAKSGISADPVSDYELSKPFMAMIWGDPDNPKVETEVIEGEQGSMGDGAI